MVSPAFSEASPALSDTFPRSRSQVRRLAVMDGEDPDEAVADFIAAQLDRLSLPVLCWDLDSTIADTLHRQPMIAKIKAGESTWDDYSLACTDDKLIPGTAWLMDMLRERHRHFIITGRSEIARELTTEWLGIRGVPWDRLIMRRQGDHRPNAELKIAILRALKTESVPVAGFFEDWPEAAARIRSEFPSLPVVVLNPCYPAGAPHANA